MTLLGHNDAHCIVLHVKHTPSCRPGLRSALALRPEIRERVSLAVPPLPSFSPASRPSSFLRFIMHRAIKETNVNHGLFSDASTRSIRETEKVGDVSERKLAVPRRDDRFASAIPLSSSDLSLRLCELEDHVARRRQAVSINRLN